MTNNPKYRNDDLVAVVWPRQSELLVRHDAKTWEAVAQGEWAMDPKKADRVRVLVAVFDDVVVGAWSVRGATHTARVPDGKSRTVSRSTFDTVPDARLGYLVGGPPPLARRRNPQS